MSTYIFLIDRYDFSCFSQLVMDDAGRAVAVESNSEKAVDAVLQRVNRTLDEDNDSAHATFPITFSRGDFFPCAWSVQKMSLGNTIIGHTVPVDDVYHIIVDYYMAHVVQRPLMKDCSPSRQLAIRVRAKQDDEGVYRVPLYKVGDTTSVVSEYLKAPSWIYAGGEMWLKIEESQDTGQYVLSARIAQSVATNIEWGLDSTPVDEDDRFVHLRVTARCDFDLARLDGVSVLTALRYLYDIDHYEYMYGEGSNDEEITQFWDDAETVNELHGLWASYV